MTERLLSETNEETNPFTISSKRITFLETKLIKEVKDLYSENYRTLMMETVNDSFK